MAKEFYRGGFVTHPAFQAVLNKPEDVSNLVGRLSGRACSPDSLGIHHQDSVGLPLKYAAHCRIRSREANGLSLLGLCPLLELPVLIPLDRTSNSQQRDIASCRLNMSGV